MCLHLSLGHHYCVQDGFVRFSQSGRRYSYIVKILLSRREPVYTSGNYSTSTTKEKSSQEKNVQVRWSDRARRGHQTMKYTTRIIYSMPCLFVLFRKKMSGLGDEGQYRMSASSRDGGDEYSSEASELDTYGTVSLYFPQHNSTFRPKIMIWLIYKTVW